MLYTTHIYLSAVSIVLLCCRGDINVTFCVSRVWMQQQTIPCALEQQACCCTVMTARKFNIRNTICGTPDLNHALPTLTNSVLSASCSVHSLADTFTLPQFLLQTVKQIFAQAVFCTNNFLQHTYYSIVHNYRQPPVKWITGLFGG